MKPILWNGRMIPPHRAKVPYLDRSVQFGYGLFETIRVCRGVTLLLRAHLSRMERSARALGLPLPRAWRRLERDLGRLLAAHRAHEAALRIVLTSGPPRPILAAHLRPLHLPSPAQQRRGVTVRIDPMVRRYPGPLAPHKTLNRLDHLWARRRGRAFETLWLDPRGHVLEGTVTNIFAVVGNRVVTPPLRAGILPGVMRAHVIRWLRRANVRVHEAPLPLAALLRAREAFLTNALIGIVPIGRLGHRQLRPGPITALAQELLARATNRAP